MGRLASGLSPSLSLVIASAFWGIGTVISKELLGSIPPILFLLIQLAPSVLVLWIVVLLSGLRPSNWRGLLPILVLGWLNPGLAYTFSMLGLAHTSASVATLLWAAEPSLIVALAWVLLRERISPGLILLTASAGAGVLLAGGGSEADLAGGGWGSGLILAGVLCCALYTVLFRGIATDLHPLAIVAIQQSVGLAWVLAISPLEGEASGLAPLLSLSGAQWLGAIVSGLMYYAIAYWFYLMGLRAMPASRAGNFLNLIPVFGIASAYLFLGERLTGAQWIGGALILGSVLLLQSRLATNRPVDGASTRPSG